MGYEFHAPAITVGQVNDNRLSVTLEIENRGVAPFYDDWKPQWGLLAHDRVVRTFPCYGSLKGLLPGESPRLWT